MHQAQGLVLHSDTFWISPYVFTCFVALREKGLPFELRRVALEEGGQHEADFAAKSVTARVPALEHQGFTVAESSAIVEYLEDVFAPPAHARVLPEDLRARARARQVLAWIRSDLGALREERPTSTMFYERADKPLTAAGELARDKLLRVAGALVPNGATSLFGAYSIADSDLAFMLHRLILNGHDVGAKLLRFAEAQWARPSVREFVEHVRPPYVPYG